MLAWAPNNVLVCAWGEVQTVAPGLDCSRYYTDTGALAEAFCGPHSVASSSVSYDDGQTWAAVSHPFTVHRSGYAWLDPYYGSRFNEDVLCLPFVTAEGRLLLWSARALGTSAEWCLLDALTGEYVTSADFGSGIATGPPTTLNSWSAWWQAIGSRSGLVSSYEGTQAGGPWYRGGEPWIGDGTQSGIWQGWLSSEAYRRKLYCESCTGDLRAWWQCCAGWQTATASGATAPALDETRVVNFATPAAPLHGLGSVCELPCGLTVLVGWVETDAYIGILLCMF
jgi:hypothetical protein